MNFRSNPVAGAQGTVNRAGGQGLSLLSAPLNVHTLKALEGNSMVLIDLRRAVGFPPQSTMRVYTRTLIKQGVLEQQRQSGFPGAIEYRITPAGGSLLKVGVYLQKWLHASPGGPIQLGSAAAKSAARALVEGWSAKIIRALAARPLSLTDLNRLIPQITYHSLERRLGALRLAGMVEPHPGNGRGILYKATPWLRMAVVPLTSAAGWERAYAPGSAASIECLDVETMFLLAVPLMELPAEFTGKCRLQVEVQRGAAPALAGVVVDFDEGKLVTCTSRLDGEVAASVSGSPCAWMRHMNSEDRDLLKVGGDLHLGAAIVAALRETAGRRIRV